MPDPPPSDPIPALVNVRAGTADTALEALEADGRFAVRRVEPGEVRDAVGEAVRAGARRVLVAGGDGDGARRRPRRHAEPLRPRPRHS